MSKTFHAVLFPLALALAMPVLAGTGGGGGTVDPTVEKRSRNDNTAYVGINWNFGARDGATVVVGYRDAKVKSNGDVDGWKVEATWVLSGAPMGFGEVRAKYLKGEREVQGELGAGFSGAHEAFLLNAGVQGPYVNGNLDYLFNKGWLASIGVNTLGKVKKPKETTTCPPGYSYDAVRNTVYWGVGNPAPAHHGGIRNGDNLFANSVVALDASSGKLRWHYQFTPGDEHDWDAVQQPVLARVMWQGQPRDVVLWANRNGFFYVLDRESGAFLTAKPFVKQTWAAGFEKDGRPIRIPESRPSRTGALVWPWVGGGTNWWPPSYDDERRSLYVPSVDAAGIYFRDENVRFQRGRLFMGGVANNAINQPTIVSIKAIAADTGNVRWESRLAQGAADIPRVLGGVLSTAGGLVFSGYRDEFFAFDSDSGEKVWQIRVGGAINAAPVSYAVDGQQFVAIMAGHALFTFSLPPSK